MRLSVQEREKFTDTYKIQFNIMNEYIIKKETVDGVNFLEKQFNNKDLLHKWLVKYNRKVNSEKENHLFTVECNAVCGLLLFFRKLNLIEDNNVHFIQTVIDNIEMYIKNIACTDFSEVQNITKVCKSYIQLNKINSIIKETDKSSILEKNTVDEIPNSFKFLNKNVKDSIKNESVNSIKSESKNTVQDINITENIESCNSYNNIKTGKSLNTDLENTVHDNKFENISKNTEKSNPVISEISDLKNTVDNKKENIKNTIKRKKYSKKDKIDNVKKTVNNIINFNIKNKELYEQSHIFNRTNIELFSNIYKKYKIETEIHDDEFNNIYINFDKNKNRFLKICKIYYEIYNEKILYNSELLFLPYCFNDISIKDDSINLFKELIIEFLNK